MRKGCMIFLLLAARTAHAASFDCSKATTPQEKAICASPKLSAADDELGAAYKAVLAAMPAGFVAEARADERSWQRNVAARCGGAESISTSELAECMLNMYQARTQELEHRVLTIRGVKFFWRSIVLTAPDAPGDIRPEIPNGEINPGFGTLEASWPQTSGSTAEWKAWNVGIEKATREMATEGSGDTSEKPAKRWAATGGVDQSVTASIGEVSDELVTSIIQNFSDGHGAHPNTYTIQFNWLLKEKRELQADDVFRSDSGWDKFLQHRCDKYLHEQLDHDGISYETFEYPGEMAKTLHQIVIDPKNWQLDSKGVTIIFQQYAVACYACTPAPMTIPWPELQPFVKSSFIEPR